MKILLINNCHYRRGGADEVYLNTGELLERNGHEVFYFSINNPHNIQCSESKYFTKHLDYKNSSIFKKFSAIPSFIFNRCAYKDLLHLLDEIKPDVAHIHLFMGGLTISILFALKKKNIPIVHSVHDYRLICPAYTFFDRNNNICEKCKDGFYLRCAFRRCSLEKKSTHSIMLTLDAYFRKRIFNPFTKIDHFIFVSQFSEKKHFEYQNQIKSRSTVLYNFNSEFNDKPNYRGDYFLFYGRLSREKGIETLIQCAINEKFSLKIVGIGPLLIKYKNLNCDNISFLGFKKGKELWDLVRNASFIIQPSECYENNPLTIVEAFSLGKPVIGSNIGGIPELLQETNGFLFESKNINSLTNVIKEALTISNETYDLMSRNAYKFAIENFSERNHYLKLINIYTSVIHDKKLN